MAEFLRHEYTWSKQSIGGTIGLGVVSSSTPKEQIQLREMEKMASMAEADSETGMEVELLMHSPEAGFVKLAVKPVPVGEDQRQNKKVYLYQCADKTTEDPAVYCIPCGSWQHLEQTYLPPVNLVEDWDSSKNIFIKYQFIDRLPDLFHAVFWCVFRGGNNLAFIVPWKREEFAIYSREIMYAIHDILPAKLRKNAGYASYGCGKNACSSFYFTDKDTDDDTFNLSTLEYHSKKQLEDDLDSFFYTTLATIYWQDEPMYQRFVDLISEELTEKQIDKNMLRQIQWIFLPFCLQNQIDIPPVQEVMGLFPQLFYSAAESDTLKEVQMNLLEYYHTKKWDFEDYRKYLDILGNGMTKKGEEQALSEMEWVLSKIRSENKTMEKDAINSIRKNKKTVFTRLMTKSVDDEESISGRYFRNHSGSLSDMREYICEMEAKSIFPGARDICLLRGIEIINDDVFRVENFKILSQIAAAIGRKEKWIEMLNGFLSQLTERCDELSEDQLEKACEIEQIYEELTQKTELTALREEKRRREGQDESEGEKLPTNQEEEKQDELYREIKEETSSGKGKFRTFLVRGIPYGFLTGCILYLLNYCIVIGHWKISLGVGGMWLILMLNYSLERIERKKQDGYRLWQALGLCVVEGYIIEAIAWLFLPKTVKVYFFLILGLATVLIQAFYGLILLKKREEEDDE